MNRNRVLLAVLLALVVHGFCEAAVGPVSARKFDGTLNREAGVTKDHFRASAGAQDLPNIVITQTVNRRVLKRGLAPRFSVPVPFWGRTIPIHREKGGQARRRRCQAGIQSHFRRRASPPFSLPLTV